MGLSKAYIFYMFFFANEHIPKKKETTLSIGKQTLVHILKQKNKKCFTLKPENGVFY